MVPVVRNLLTKGVMISMSKACQERKWAKTVSNERQGSGTDDNMNLGFKTWFQFQSTNSVSLCTVSYKVILSESYFPQL